MRLYQKHPKPLQQDPSKKLVEYLKEITIPEMPIADIACGYGRNGAYLAAHDHSVTFVDVDKNCLDFISVGKNVSETGDIPLDKIKVIQADLIEEWPFETNSLGGIICVHFYYPGLINKWIASIAQKGFLYFETIEARSCNINSLPYENEIKSMLKKDFTILHYSEREVKNSFSLWKKVSCTSFAIIM